MDFGVLMMSNLGSRKLYQQLLLLLSTNEDLLESSIRNKNPQFLFQTKDSNSNDDNFYFFQNRVQENHATKRGATLTIDNAQVLNKTSKINKETHKHLVARLDSIWKVCHVGSSDLRKTPRCYVERTLFGFDN